MTKELYDNYKSLGFILAPLDLNTKKPLYTRKKNGVCNDKTYAWNKDRIFYAVPTKGLLIIDVDVKNGKKGLESLEKLAEDLDLDLGVADMVASVQTGSGGLHIYVKTSKPFKAIQPNYPDIDFQSYRANPELCAPYVVCGGQEFKFEGKIYPYTMLTDGIHLNEFDKLDEVLLEDVAIEPVEDDDMFPTEHPERALELLQHISPCCDEPTWFKIGVMLKAKVVDGFKVFDEWSQGCPDKYDEHGTIVKWESMPTSSTSNIGMLVNMAKNEKFTKAKEFIQNSTKVSEVEEYFKSKLWNSEPHNLPSHALGDLANLIKQGDFDEKITLPNAKKLISPEIVKDIAEVREEADWLEDIAYVQSYGQRAYVILSTGERLNNLAVSGRYPTELQETKKLLAPKSKAKFTMDTLVSYGAIPICSGHEYNPTTNDKIFIDESGKKIFNIFNASTRPPIAEEFTDEGLELISKFEQHLRFIMDEDEVEILLDYFAYLAQNIGQKVLWCPLIQSAQGLGKSVIGNVMINHVFGTANGGTVDSNVVVSPNTSWATNGVFRVLEEIKLTGHNRYEIINHLKPFITNPTVSRVEKFEASEEVRNFMNYLALTNFKDAVPVDDGDRRWWLVFSKLKSLSELEKLSGMSANEYFEPLHTLAVADCKQGGEFHKWLIERDISKFNPNFPPESKHKAEVIATEEAMIEHYTDLKELLNTGAVGVSKDLLSFKALKTTITHSGDWEGEIPQDNTLTVLLKRMGFTKYHKRLEYQGVRHSVWVSSTGNEDMEVRDTFRILMQGNPTDGFDDLDIEDL